MENKTKKKLWNKDFILLWQGQLVSYLGDVIYSFALSFWVLEVTGSTALMGIVTAVSMAPRLILGPLAGVWVDKLDRKKIIVICDLIRGIILTYIGVAAFMGTLKIWMVFAAGISSSICSAFFGPAVTSVKPDLVDSEEIVRANSITSFSQAGSSALGSMAGGVIYAFAGAPYMFLFDGISYLISAFTEVFINVPKTQRKEKKLTFKEDFKEGFSFIWNLKAFRTTFVICSAVNFFANAAFVLMVPMFSQSAFLGVKRYGIAMAVASIGMMAGSVITGIVNVKPKYRYMAMAGSFLVESVICLFLPVVKSFWPIVVFAPISCGLNMVGNTVFDSVCMIIIPEDKRGKVFSLIQTFSMGLTPIGIAVGGVLGQVIPVRMAMFILLLITLIISAGFLVIRPIKTLFNYDPEKESLEEMMMRSNLQFAGNKKILKIKESQEM